MGGYQNNDSPSIGSTNVSCEVYRTVEVTMFAAGECGYNDILAPNSGIFLREYQQCTRYDSHGKVVETWYRVVHKFLRCLE